MKLYRAIERSGQWKVSEINVEKITTQSGDEYYSLLEPSNDWGCKGETLEIDKSIGLSREEAIAKGITNASNYINRELNTIRIYRDAILQLKKL